MRYSVSNSIRYIRHHKVLSIIIVLLLMFSSILLAISIAGMSGTNIATDVEFQLQEGDIFVSWSGKVLTEKEWETLSEEIGVPVAIIAKSHLRIGDILYPTIYVSGDLPLTNVTLTPIEQAHSQFEVEGVEGYYEFLQPVLQVSYSKASQHLEPYTQQYLLIQNEGKRLSRYVTSILAKHDNTSVVHDIQNHVQYMNYRRQSTRANTLYQIVIAIVIMMIAVINMVVTLQQYIQQMIQQMAIKVCIGATENHVMCEVGMLLGVYFTVAISVVLFNMPYVIEFFGLTHYAYWGAKESVLFVGLCAEFVMFCVWYFMMLFDKHTLTNFLASD